MSTSTILSLLIVCAALLLCGGLLLIVAVAVLWFVLGRGGDEELEAPAPTPAPIPVAPAPAPPAGRSLDAALARSAQASRRPDEALKPYGGVEDDGGKTEVFTRGNLNLDWDDDHVEGEATEIFRADLHNHDDFKMD